MDLEQISARLDEIESLAEDEQIDALHQVISALEQLVD
jgi:hypothetical protein